MHPDDVLLGRLAVHFKLVPAESLEAAAEHWRRAAKAGGGTTDFGTTLVNLGILTAHQLQQLLAARKQYQVRLELKKQAHDEGESETTEQLGGEAPPEPRYPPRPSMFENQGRALLAYAVDWNASDIHVHEGSTLHLRRGGALEDFGGEPFVDEDLKVLSDLVLDAPRLRILAEAGQIDFGFEVPGVARFRGNAYRRQGGTDIVLRTIPLEAPSLAELGLPENLGDLVAFHQGLVLVTGPMGCGKSTTLAALIRRINETRRDHVIAVEDPIEFLHPVGHAVINQRQIERDTGSFARALRAALREDPDVIVVGELRDYETISLALTAAETGHLVLGSLHTGNAVRTIDRIIGVFPPSRQGQIRSMLSESLRAVISQRLVRRADGKGRVPALEILIGTRAAANLIREGKTFQLRSAMQTGFSHGMVLLDVSLGNLVRQGTITREEALLYCEDPKSLTIGPGVPDEVGSTGDSTTAGGAVA